MAKVILISQFPLPYSHIGSWTNIYKNYFETGHQIDYVICEKTDSKFSDVTYEIVKDSYLTKIRRRIKHYYRIGFIDALEKIIRNNPGQKFVIQLVDNFQMAYMIDKNFTKKGLRNQCYLQVFYHGFGPFIDESRYPGFFEKIDELVLLTNDSYKAHKQYYNVFPCKTSTLYNGIDTGKFHKLLPEEKQKLKNSNGYAGKTVFIWCSQDRPKKGLQLILDVWKSIYSNNKNTVLLVVGAKRDLIIDGVVFVGRVPNQDLPKYYQMSDCYLFPSLCHEGFGMSLIEALNCGCYCIASNAGGIPEVLHYGKYGKLIENPNYVSEWEIAINDYLSGKSLPIVLDKPLYTMEEWSANMDKIINNAKQHLS